MFLRLPSLFSNKILEINTIEEKTIYFYTGELITKSQYLGDFSNGVYYVSEITDYTYDNSGRLSKSVTVKNDTSNNNTNKTTKTTTYSYLSNSLIKITENEDAWYMAAFFRQVKIGVLTLTLEKKQ